jgi:ribonuclease Z
MKIVLLGTAGYHPSETRHTACVMLPELGIVLDAGTSMFRVRDRLITEDLDIFLSHAHLDHIVGLTYLLDILYGRTMRRVCVHADPRSLVAIEANLLSEQIFPVKLPCDYQPLLPAGSLPVAGGGRATWFPLTHPGGSTGFRFDWPTRSFAYITDTTANPTADYIEKIQGVDLLLHECNFRDGQEDLAERTGHSSASQVAAVAKAANVGRLVILHVNPLEPGDDPVGLESMRAIFPRTEIGVDLMELDF